MRLPVAAPGYTGGVLTVRVERCWANREYKLRGTAQCNEPVDLDDDLGLCEAHREELLES